MIDEEVRCDYAQHHEDSYTWCTLSDNVCIRDTGDCDEINDLIKEMKEESNENQQ